MVPLPLLYLTQTPPPIARYLGDLDNLWDWLLKLSAKDNVPEAVGNSKSILIIHEVVLHVPLLGLLVEGWEAGVVQEVMCEVVDDVARDSTAEDGSSHVPVPEQRMCKLPERQSKHDEKCRWHNQAISVHRQVVVNAVQEEMGSESEAVVRQIAGKMSILRNKEMKYCGRKLTRQGGRGNGADRTRQESTRKGRS